METKKGQKFKNMKIHPRRILSVLMFFVFKQ